MPGAKSDQVPPPNDWVALLLPGMTLNSTIFPDLGIPTLAPDFTTLQLGADGTCRELAEGGMAVYAALLDELLQADGRWDAARRIVVAHSFGGMLALRWLLEHRCSGLAAVTGLVLVATTAGPMFDRVSLRLLGVQELELRVGVRFLMGLWNRPSVTRLMKRLTSGMNMEVSAVDFQALGITSDLELDIAGWRNTDWRAMRSYRLALAGFDVRERLGEIPVPTIVLHGTEDSLFEPHVARELAQGLPHCELRLVPGAGHALTLTHETAVINAVRDLQQG
ncbi:MAG: alpha/beta hydrolase [Gemmatimonadota bacterium]|nr:MAG: alpha/beta hydrolase [Gemmatimonadota bacterium]